MGRPPKDLNPDGSFAQHFGWRIRKCREEQGWSQEELAERLACGKSQVSRLEHGEAAPDRPTAKLLDTIFNTTYFTEHQTVAARERIPQAARSLADHESGADVIQSFMPTVVVGLLQTDAYVRALALASATPNLADEVVSERVRRQSVLEGEQPTRLSAIMEEGALRRPVGDPEVMRDQIAALLERGRKRNIRIQVVPERIGAYPGAVGGFSHPS